ncbi:MAG: indolepyruvate oxidoreductase subunit beta [Proteobacteria bacterium]|nr:indolepyruvate oxidoreductase subunit beta [Pseudomonadota bacterium]MBU4121966.1 indolepyruvate oxidoreductase subunit beta [Pseudomonadota bacterium]
MDTKGILIAGVGGQGILLASDILCRVMMAADLDVKKSEVHGMAQRGGCVTSHVRYGQKVYSPIARKNDVDILVSFEKMDTLRYLDFLKPEGTIIINTEELYPPAVNLGDAVYPEDIIESVRQLFGIVKVVDATGLAVRAGNIRAVNTVLLGTLSSYLPLPLELWETVLRNAFSPKLLEANLKAFQLGRAV